MGRWTHLYQTTEWRKRRARFLRAHPLCVMCTSIGRITAASVVDHIQPHRGDLKLFWDLESNAQALCKRHHDSTKQHHEAKPDIGCDVDGNPRRKMSHW